MKKYPILLIIITFGILSNAQDRIILIKEINQLSNNSLPLFKKYQYIQGKLALAVLPADLIKDNPNITDIGPWAENKHYYALHPIYNQDINLLTSFGTVLYSSKELIIFSSDLSFLKDSVFHAFEKQILFDISEHRPIRKIDAKRASLHANKDIQALVRDVNVDSMWNNMIKLCKLERYTTSSKASESKTFLKDFLKANGYIPEEQAYSNGHTPNVFAVKTGKTNPDQIVIIGGHYDTYKEGEEGADDNASGTAAVLEAARLMAKYDFKKTIHFVLFSGEEIGLKGSSAYAKKMNQANAKIEGMINLDVTAHQKSGEPLNCDVSYNTNTLGKEFYSFFKEIAKTYLPGKTIIDASNLSYAGSSDHASFWDKYKTIFISENKRNRGPWHTSDDKMNTSANSKAMQTLTTQCAVATCAGLAEVNSPVEIYSCDVPKNKNEKFRAHYNRKSQLLSIDITENTLLSETCITLYTIHGKLLYKINLSPKQQALSLSLPMDKAASGSYCVGMSDRNLAVVQNFVFCK